MLTSPKSWPNSCMGAFQAPTHGGDCTMPYGLKWEEVDVVHPKWRCDNLGLSVPDPHLRTRISHGLVLYTVRGKKEGDPQSSYFQYYNTVSISNSAN